MAEHNDTTRRPRFNDRPLTQDRLKKHFNYNPDTGILSRIRSIPGAKTGPVGYAREGYLEARILGKQYRVHRVIWFYMTGVWPEEVDHINHDRTDNRWCNLRNVDRLTNQRNKPILSSNTSGCAGVHLRKDTGKWKAYITADCKRIYLGEYSTFSDAVAARKSAERDHGFHPNHGYVSE